MGDEGHEPNEPNEPSEPNDHNMSTTSDMRLGGYGRGSLGCWYLTI